MSCTATTETLSLVCELHELLRSSFGLLILGLIKWRISVVMIMPSVTYNKNLTFALVLLKP